MTVPRPDLSFGVDITSPAGLCGVGRRRIFGAARAMRRETQGAVLSPVSCPCFGEHGHETSKTALGSDVAQRFEAYEMMRSQRATALGS